MTRCWHCGTRLCTLLRCAGRRGIRRRARRRNAKAAGRVKRKFWRSGLVRFALGSRPAAAAGPDGGLPSSRRSPKAARGRILKSGSGVLKSAPAVPARLWFRMYPGCASDVRATRQQLGIGWSSQYSQPVLSWPRLKMGRPQATKQALLAVYAAFCALQLSWFCAATPRLVAGMVLEPSAAPGGTAGMVVSSPDMALVGPTEVVDGVPLKPVARLGLGTTTSFTTCGSVEFGRSPKWTLPLLSFQRYTSARAPPLPNRSETASEK